MFCLIAYNCMHISPLCAICNSTFFLKYFCRYSNMKKARHEINQPSLSDFAILLIIYLVFFTRIQSYNKPYYFVTGKIVSLRNVAPYGTSLIICSSLDFSTLPGNFGVPYFPLSFQFLIKQAGTDTECLGASQG